MGCQNNLKAKSPESPAQTERTKKPPRLHIRTQGRIAKNFPMYILDRGTGFENNQNKVLPSLSAPSPSTAKVRHHKGSRNPSKTENTTFLVKTGNPDWINNPEPALATAEQTEETPVLWPKTKLPASIISIEFLKFRPT